MFYPDRCIGCRRCVAVCPQGAHTITDAVHVYLRDKCVSCGKCAETCYAGALMVTGRWMTVDEVVEEVLRDKIFYETSNGGVTISGGDPFVQIGFSRALLERCKAEGLHTAIETAANCAWSSFAKTLPVIDLVVMDIKHLDPEKHRKATSVLNNRILNNALSLAKTGKPLIIRVPVIPGVNDTPEEIGAIARFVKEFPNLQYLELLPFHRLGESKYDALGLEYPARHLKTPTKEKMKTLAEEAERNGVNVRVG